MKALFVGLDALDKDLLLRWVEEGKLPTFASLFQTAAWALTSNPTGLYVGAVWPSTFTSVQPDKHGRYCWEQIQSGSYDTRAFIPSHLEAAPIWEAFSQAGKRVAVIDVPKAPLSESINGFQIADWGTHDPDFRTGMRTYPAELADEVVNRFGNDPIGKCNDIDRDSDGIRDFTARLIERIATKFEITRFIFEQEDWDCLFTVFSEGHCVGHQCWHIIDSLHPRHDPNLAAEVGNPILDVYQALDSTLADLLEMAGDNVPVLILSSHGMGPHYEATYLLDKMLKKLEAYAPPKSYPLTTQFLSMLWAILPKTIRHLLRPTSNKIKTVVDPVTRGTSSRKYFKVPNNDVFGGIRINLKGREPGGIVEAGEQYARICARLIEDLSTFINADTGEPLVKQVISADDVYAGPLRGHLPDLMVEWNRSAPINAVYSPKTGRIDGGYAGVRTGDHKSEGILFLNNAGLNAGQINSQVSCVDVGPTLATFLGVQLADTDGKSLVSRLGVEIDPH